jgi:hypothetical protein
MDENRFVSLAMLISSKNKYNIINHYQKAQGCRVSPNNDQQ